MPEHSIATRKITRRVKHNFAPGVTRCMIRLITMVCCVRGVALPRRGPQCRRALVRRREGCRCHCSLKHILSLESGTLFLSPSQSSSLLLHTTFSLLFALFRSRSSSTNVHSNSLQCSLRIPNIAYSVLLPNTQYRLFGIVGKPRQDPNLHRSIRMLEITLFESASRSIVRYYWYYPGKLETAVFFVLRNFI